MSMLSPILGHHKHAHFDGSIVLLGEYADVNAESWTALPWVLDDGGTPNDSFLDLTDPAHPVANVAGLYIFTMCANIAQVDGSDYSEGALAGAPPFFTELDAGPVSDSGEFYTAGWSPLDVPIASGAFPYPIGLVNMSAVLPVGGLIVVGLVHKATGKTLRVEMSGQVTVLPSY